MENGRWQQNPLRGKHFEESGVFTILMPQITVGNGNCKNKSLQQICKKEGIFNKISNLS